MRLFGGGPSPFIPPPKYASADTLTNKMHELQAKIFETKTKIVAVVKIHPKNYRYQLTAKKLCIKILQMFFELDAGGRGVCIYAHNSLNAHLNSYLPQNLTDTMFVEISNTKTKSFIVSVIYRSPNSSLSHSKNLNEMIDNLHICYKDIIFVGDRNYPGIDGKAKQNMMSANHPSSGFLQSCSNASLVQLVSEPTRVKRVGAGNILDLVLANCKEIVNQIAHEPPIGKSDHITILLNITRPKVKREKLPSHYLHYKGDYGKMKTYLCGVNWDEDLDHCHIVEDMWTVIVDKLLLRRDQYIPAVRPTPNYRERPPWINIDILQLVKQKHKSYPY